jgi:signal transduction histidine kinase
VHAQKLATLRHPVRIEVQAEAMSTLVSGDKRRLERVVANLLDNADRYARTGIDMRLDRVEAPEGGSTGQLVLTVDDDGPGVPEEERARIFDRFARLTGGARRGDGGAGLGLALVRQHVLAHGGSIEVGDAPSGGARFVVRLPVHLPVWEESGSPLPRTPSVRGTP